MNKEKLAELEALAAEAKQRAEEAGADESLNSALAEAEAAVESAKKELEAGEDIDFKKELEKVAGELPPPPPRRSEKEKAKFTMDKILERFPDLQEDFSPESDDDKVSKVREELLRNQVEGIIRANSKNNDEVKYKMFFYDHRIVKTGNIHEDADNADWLANKARTRNAISEMRRSPPNTDSAGGSGQKPLLKSTPELPPSEVKRLTALGLKQVAPDRWEGTKAVLQYDKAAKKWDLTIKQASPKK